MGNRLPQNTNPTSQGNNHHNMSHHNTSPAQIFTLASEEAKDNNDGTISTLLFSPKNDC